MPGVGPAQFQWLIERFDERANARGLMTRHDAQIEPFPSIFRRSATMDVAAQLDAGRMSVQKLTDQPAIVALDAPEGWDQSVWTNLNRPEDLEAFVRKE
jgi:molybdopterin-guanine dinucleotide biosynthesis protein A